MRLKTFVITAFLAVLILATTMQLRQVKAAVDATGIISSDAIWTKENSPYTLKGNVAVPLGVTLVIEPGVTVFGSHYMQINGTLRAKGDVDDPIRFNGAEIRFMPSSNDWDEQSGSGSILEYTRGLSMITTNDASPKINENRIGGISEDGNAHNIGGVLVNGGSPMISNNEIDNALIYAKYDSSPNIIGIYIASGSPVVFNNKITGVIISGGSPLIVDNLITRGSNSENFPVISVYGGTPVISKNTIISGVYAWQQWGQGLYVEPGGSRNFPGIIASGGDVIISDNYIQNCLLGIVACQGTIERNYIFNNTGVGLEIDHGTVIVRNNTIKNNDLGIKLANSLSATINYNNIQDSVHTSLYLENTPNNIDATNNWWGTGDTGVISASIQDFDDDFNLGKVNFEPILTAQNPHAMPDRNAPTPTLTPETPSNTSPSPSQNSTSTPNQLSNQGSTQVDLSGAVVAVLVVTTVVALLVAGTVFLRRRAR